MARSLTNLQALDNHEDVVNKSDSVETGVGIEAADRSVSVGSVPPLLPSNMSLMSSERIPCFSISFIAPERIRSSLMWCALSWMGAARPRSILSWVDGSGCFTFFHREE